MIIKRRRLETMPFAHSFITENGNEELCNATGYEVYEEYTCDLWGEVEVFGQWWTEYIDSAGNLHYGN